MHILIAEDNEVNLKLLHRALAPYNVTLAITLNGREALDYLANPQNPRPDIFLLDMAMPVIGGREVLENIRTKRPFIDDPIIQTIPIIVMGPHLFRSDYQRWRDFGVNDVIPKPIKFRYIRQVLLKCSRRELAPPFHGNMPGPGAGRGVMMRPVWGPMPLRGYQGPRSLL